MVAVSVSGGVVLSRVGRRAARTVTPRRPAWLGSMAAPRMMWAFSQWRVICSMKELTSLNERSGPPTRLTGAKSLSHRRTAGILRR